MLFILWSNFWWLNVNRTSIQKVWKLTWNIYPKKFETFWKFTFSLCPRIILPTHCERISKRFFPIDYSWGRKKLSNFSFLLSMRLFSATDSSTEKEQKRWTCLQTMWPLIKIKLCGFGVLGKVGNRLRCFHAYCTLNMNVIGFASLKQIFVEE